MDAWCIDTKNTRDLAPLLLDASGALQVVSADLLAQTTAEERARFGVEHGIYGLLTEDLIHFLRTFIAGRRAIEIGAGHGRLAAALNIPATDNRQQEEPDVKAYYEALGQPPVRYGGHVERLEAADAISLYRPEIVIASWVTHRYRPERHEAGGNASGVDEEGVIAACDAYVLIGNTRVHQHKSIWSLPHRRIEPPWLYSRAINGTPDFIAIWERPQAAEVRNVRDFEGAGFRLINPWEPT